MTEPKKKHKTFALKYLFVDFVRVTGALPTLLWYRPKILYENNNAKQKIRGGALLISNHNCFFDPIYIMIALWYRRHHIVCNQEFYNTKARWFLKQALTIPIDIDNPGFATMREINDHLTAGELVSMFPEGHVNDGSGNMRQFKSGMVLMAMRAKVPIVPVYVCEHKPCSSRLRVVVGEPIDINKLFGDRPTMSEIESVTEQLFNKENELKAIAFQR